jgi:hypothetical protein
VIDDFERLPALDLLVFFDDADDPFFRRSFGTSNRGFFVVLEGTRTIEWPPYLASHLYAHDYSTAKVQRLFDFVIYQYGSTCGDLVGRIMKLAHELQHFVQYGFYRNLWAASQLLRVVQPTSDIPIEREARIIAKRIASRLCGVDKVEQYIARKIKEGAEAEDIADWAFVQRLDASIYFDLESETQTSFRAFDDRRDEIQKQFQNCKQRPEFHNFDLSSYYPNL